MNTGKRLFLAAVLGMLGWIPAWGNGTATCQPQTIYKVEAPSGDVKAEAAKLETDPAYDEAHCVALRSEGNTLTYHCAKAGAQTDTLFRDAAQAGMTVNSTTISCPPNCTLTFCPYPAINCCNNLTHQPCPPQ